MKTALRNNASNYCRYLLFFQVTHYSEIYGWVLFVFIPTVFVGPWYNGMPAVDSEDGLLIDRVSTVVGMARLRQLRVLNGKH